MSEGRGSGRRGVGVEAPGASASRRSRGVRWLSRIGELGDHPIDRFVAGGERRFQVMNDQRQRDRRIRIRQFLTRVMHDAGRPCQPDDRKGDLGGTQLVARVIGELGEKGTVSGRGPKFARREQDTVRA